VSKRKKKQPDIDILDQHMGKSYKLWSERSDRDFERWLNVQSYFSPLYRVAYFVSGIILILIGVILLLTGSNKDGIVFIFIGIGIIILIVLGSMIKL